jgi:hypothetical protein
MSLFEPFYDAADMSACVPALSSIAELNARAAKDGIRFPLWRDEKESFASLYLNTRICSRSFRFGMVGDNTLGCRFSLTSGKTVDLGGRVVKNVVGFDLCRFFAGSRGRLGSPLNMILRLRPLPEIQRSLKIGGSAGALEAFRAALMKSAWVHCIDAFDFELDASGLRLGLAYACTAHEAPIFESALLAMAKGCKAEGAPLPSHASLPPSSRLAPLSKVLSLAADLQSQYGGRVSGFLGQGLMLFEPERPLPLAPADPHADLEAEMLARLEALA